MSSRPHSYASASRIWTASQSIRTNVREQTFYSISSPVIQRIGNVSRTRAGPSISFTVEMEFPKGPQHVSDVEETDERG
jgi:hypothetical protein